MRVFRSGRRLVLLGAAVAILGQASADAQSGQAPAPAAPATPPVVTGPVRQLTVDEAVQLALEQNLEVQAQRLNPQVQDYSVAQARTAWTPSFSAGVFGQNQDAPPSSFLSGGTDVITTQNAGTELAVSQLLPWGTNYAVSWDSARMTTNNIFTQ